jgi:hypothetical protein
VVLISINVDGFRPPSGAVVVDEGESEPFAGWLQLLGILDRMLLAPAGSVGSALRLHGQLDPGAEAKLGQDVGHVGVDRVP